MNETPSKPAPQAEAALRPGTLVLVGLMGSGKTSVGRKLARKLGMAFVDADEEVEKAAGCSVEDIFRLYGEAAFRDGEERVVARLFEGPPIVLATGGGAFMNPRTRTRIKATGVSIWLRADLDLLVHRTRRGGRPLLANGDPRRTLEKLMAERHPTYAEADIVVDTRDEETEVTVKRILTALRDHAGDAQAKKAAAT